MSAQRRIAQQPVAQEPVLPELDFAWAGETRVPAGATYGPYTTVYWEFIWCMEGSAQVRSADQEFTFSTGSVQLTPPGERNYYQWHPVTGTRYGYAIFTMEKRYPHWPRFRGPRTDDIVAPLLDHVLWLDATHPEGWRESATTALGYAIRAFAAGASATRLEPDRQLPDVIMAAVEAVRQRWDTEGTDQPSLGELADAAGVTREYLCRVFARHVGLGPVAAIRTLRLHRAAALLSSTNLGIAEIAQHLGFNSEFQFSRSFRTLTGQAPTAFRRDHGAGLDLSVPLRQLGRHLNLL
ncbi:MAG TPA: AraC family transcriptional regulator [Beutenbergiaceae bacterium]|nr:AraC family transcriptional regulator [Beutenbergiaceae bacterium]